MGYFLILPLFKSIVMKILGMGNALVDILVKIDNDNILEELSLPRGSMQLVDIHLSRKILYQLEKYQKSISAGGAAANTIHALGKLGIEAGFVGVVGEDEMGRNFRQGMESVNVTAHLMLGRQESGHAVVFVSPDSERTFATFLGAAVELKPHHLKLDLLKGYDLLYVEGYLVQNQELVRKAVTEAKKNFMSIALDMASYNVVEANRAFFHEIISGYVDIVFANEDEAKALTGKKPMEALHEIAGMCRIAVVKTGKTGSLVQYGDTVLRIDPIDAECIDTTGAGDLYAAGFLYGLANNLSIERCGQIGSILGGTVIQVIGAKLDEARWEKIRSKL
jgi:sugar/nucleoside kinase (ribokinase family)